MTQPLKALHDLGQSIWLDNINRDMIDNGDLARLINDQGLRGITSNPSIFEKAITTGNVYDSVLAKAKAANPDASSEYLFQEMAIEDIRDAANLFNGVYDESRGHDGLVSIEVSPELAHDTEGTIKEALDLWARLDTPNVMIKVPATKAGLPAIEKLISEGLNVNVTLLFSVERYIEVARAFKAGLRARHAAGKPIDRIASVASFFVSRVDAAIDPMLDMSANPEAKSLAGKSAILNAKVAYARFQDEFSDAEFGELAAAGAQAQRLLWASTSTKNPDFPDVLYVDTLIGGPTVNTLPPATLDAVLDHGTVASTLADSMNEAEATLSKLSDCGVSLDKVTEELETKGVEAFQVSFRNLLEAIENKLAEL